MSSESKYCYRCPSSKDKHNSLLTVVGEKFHEWFAHSKPPLQHKCSIPDVSERRDNLTIKAGCTMNKYPTSNSKIWDSLRFVLPPFVLNGTKQDMEPTSHFLEEKEQYLKHSVSSSTSCIPIFETNKYGKGQLTVPLDCSSTLDDISMTPAGVYVEDMASSECSALRPRRVRKRRKDLSKTNQHAHMGSEASGKSCDKNRKEKKRYPLQRDIFSDNRTLSFDDSYSYDYRGAAPSKSMYISPLPQHCHSAGFSPASTGSVGSFQDALQDIVPVENMHLLTSSDEASAFPGTTCCNLPQSIPAKQTVIGRPVPETLNTTITDYQEQRKCDMEPEYVMVTNNNVRTIPSVSSVQRRDEEDEDEDELDHSDYTSDDFTEDEGEEYPILGGVDYDDNDEDDDDDSIVFCEDYDDLHGDSNSSSGFDERKVRFNMKLAVHIMRVWDFAYRQARKGDWEMAARDRERFRKRIADLEPVLGPALQPALRDKVYAERFSGQDKYAQDLKLDVNRN